MATKQAEVKDDITVSVVIPCYNGERYVSGAIDSVLRQSKRPDEIIVVNDGSIDATDKILNQYGKKIKIIKQDNLGLSRARNTGIYNAKSKWVGFLDADDNWHNEMIKNLAIAVQMAPEVDIWFTDFWHVTPEGDYIDLGSERHLSGLALAQWRTVNQNIKIMTGGWLVSTIESTWQCSSTLLMKRQLIKDIGGYAPDCIRAEDLDLYLRIYDLVPIVGYINIPLAKITQHPNSLCRGSGREETSKQVAKILEQFRLKHKSSFVENKIFRRKLSEVYAALSYQNRLKRRNFASFKYAIKAMYYGAMLEGGKALFRSISMFHEI